MRAIQIEQWTEPAGLQVTELPEPVAGPDEVLIRIRAASVSHSLSLLIAGRYQRRPPLPFIPGNTAAGEVVALGEAVRRWSVGDRVLATLEHGGLAEKAVAHQDNVYGIPASMPFAEATTLNASYNSVAAALTWPHLLDVQPGQTLLVTGATGGVGIAALQIGRLLGARVIAAASTPSKRERALHEGAHHAVPGSAEQLRDAVLGLGGVVDRAIEPVGGAILEQVLRCLRPEGRVLPIGFASGEIPRIPANLLLVKNITVCGLYMGYYKIDARSAHADRMRALFAQLGQWWQSGSIRPVVAGRHALDQVPQAFTQVLDRDNIGHVVVEPG
jgi:NADPH:quinone reductase